jgi:hypothetical protein
MFNPSWASSFGTNLSGLAGTGTGFASGFAGAAAPAAAGAAGAAGAGAGMLGMFGGPVGLGITAATSLLGGALQGQAQAQAQSEAMAYDWAKGKRDQIWNLASQNAFRDQSTAAAQRLEQSMPFARRSGLGRTEAFQNLLSVMPASAARRESFFNV